MVFCHMMIVGEQECVHMRTVVTLLMESES